MELLMFALQLERYTSPSVAWRQLIHGERLAPMKAPLFAVQ